MPDYTCCPCYTCQYASTSISAEGRSTQISIFPVWPSPSPTPLYKAPQALVGFLWKRVVRITIYLDDMLILAGQSELDLFVHNIWLLW